VEGFHCFVGIRHSKTPPRSERDERKKTSNTSDDSRNVKSDQNETAFATPYFETEVKPTTTNIPRANHSILL
jgi:hypothetical protein